MLRKPFLVASSDTMETQVVSFFWDDFKPHLVCYNRKRGALEDLSLSDKIDLFVSRDRRCVGYEDDEGYHPCPSGRKAGVFGMCPSCSSTWFPEQRCVFEPKCKGELCQHPEFCRRDHVIYLAYFGTLMKVGMTSERRLRGRGIEQGADAIAPIYQCPGRLEARQLEREVSQRFKINQEFRAKRVLAQLGKGNLRDKIEAKYRSTLIRLSMWREPLGSPLFQLDGYPLKLDISDGVEMVEVEGYHTGRIIGIKGKFLFYDNSGKVRALDLSDLPSRWVKANFGSDGLMASEQ